MNRILHHLSRVCITLLLLVSAMTSFAYNFTVNGLYYSITSSTDLTVAVTYKTYSSGGRYSSASWYTDCSGDIVIPSSVSNGGVTYNVTSISAHAFDDANITSIVLPNTITSIGAQAFAYCDKLSSINIPSSVTSIGDGAFLGSGLTEPVMTSTAMVYCPTSYQGEYHIPMGITSIGNYAFYNCTKLTSVIVPHGVTSIGNYAFYGCTSLASISLPATVTSLGSHVFHSCTILKALVLPNNVDRIGSYFIGGCSSLESFVIPVGVTSLPKYCFYEAGGVKKLTFPKNLYGCDEWACNGLKSLTDIYDFTTAKFKNSLESHVNGPVWYNYGNGMVIHMLEGQASLPDQFYPSTNKVEDLQSVTSLSLNMSKMSVMEGKTMTLQATVASSNASVPTIYWSSDNTDVATVDNSGVVTAHKTGTATISAETVDGSDLKATCAVSVIAVSSNHEFVDLGLPSGTLWATTNLGATNPEDYGDYFAWGETEPSDNYDWSTYKWCEGTNVSMTKYCANNNYGVVDGKDELDLVDDAAYVNWGAEWRIPSATQISELINGCDRKIAYKNGVPGVKLTSIKNGNWIFLPLAGERNYTSLDKAGSYGYYWARAVNLGYSNGAFGLYSSTDLAYFGVYSCDYRCLGRSIRPVYTIIIKATNIYLDKLTLSLDVNGTSTLDATVLPENATSKTVTWKSSNESVATVSSEGNVTAVAVGKATITCETTDGSGLKAICEVTVQAPISKDSELSDFENVVYVEKVTGYAGTQMTYSLKMKNNIEAAGFQADVYLPDGVTFAKDGDGFVQAGFSTARIDANKVDFFAAKIQEDGALRLLCSLKSGYAFSGNDGEVATFTVNISEEITLGDYPVTLKLIDISDKQAGSHSVDCFNATLTVALYMLGDANCDCNVTVSDFTAIANHILGSTPASFVEKAADVNEDGKISVSDLTGVANIILYGSVTGAASVAALVGDEALSVLSVDVADFSLAAGQMVDVPVCIQNVGADFSAYQFDLTLPEGIVVEDIVLSTERTSVRATDFFSWKQLADGSYRVLCASTSGSVFEGADGAVAILRLTAVAEAMEGIHELSIDNIELSRDGRGMHVDGLSKSFKIDGVTGLDVIDDDKSDSQEVYDLTGKRISDGNNTGIRIVKNKKYIIK